MGKGEAKCRRRAGRGEGGEWDKRRDTDGGVADGHRGHAGSGASLISVEGVRGRGGTPGSGGGFYESLRKLQTR